MSCTIALAVERRGPGQLDIRAVRKPFAGLLLFGLVCRPAGRLFGVSAFIGEPVQEGRAGPVARPGPGLRTHVHASSPLALLPALP